MAGPGCHRARAENQVSGKLAGHSVSAEGCKAEERLRITDYDTSHSRPPAAARTIRPASGEIATSLGLNRSDRQSSEACLARHSRILRDSSKGSQGPDNGMLFQLAPYRCSP